MVIWVQQGFYTSSFYQYGSFKVKETSAATESGPNSVHSKGQGPLS